jgi:hypothetical protein
MRIFPAAVLPLCLALAAPLSAQVVHGRLLDAGTGAAVASARVRLLAGDAAADSALTDSAGAFALRAEAGGIFRLAAERVGYAASVSRELEMEDDDSLEVVFRIAPDAVVLDPLEVVATGKYRGPQIDAFYRRAERHAFGTFVTRAEIEKTPTYRTTDLLRRVAGLRVLPSRRPGVSSVRGRGGCLPVVIVDGMELQGAATLLDEWVKAYDVEGIEVYTGAAQAPPELAIHENGCATIIIWTR